MAEARREIIRQVYEDPRTGFGNLEATFRQARARNPHITRGEVRQYLNSLIVRQDRPERGYNSFVPPEPMFQLQVDLVDMAAFSQGPLVTNTAPKKVRRTSVRELLLASIRSAARLTAAPVARVRTVQTSCHKCLV